MHIIEAVADEGSSFFPTVEFLDEFGQAVVPDALFWRLTDLAGNVINGRAAVEVAVPAATLAVALTGADLMVLGDNVATRIWTVYGSYTSSIFGANQTFSLQARFNVQPRVGG